MQYVRGVVGKGGLRMRNCDGFGLGGALVFCVCVCVLVLWSCGVLLRNCAFVVLVVLMVRECGGLRGYP